MVRKITYKKSKIASNIGMLLDWYDEAKNKETRQRQVDLLYKNMMESAYSKIQLKERRSGRIVHELVYYVKNKKENWGSGKLRLKGYVRITKKNNMAV